MRTSRVRRPARHQPEMIGAMHPRDFHRLYRRFLATARFDLEERMYLYRLLEDLVRVLTGESHLDPAFARLPEAARTIREMESPGELEGLLRQSIEVRQQSRAVREAVKRGVREGRVIRFSTRKRKRQ